MRNWRTIEITENHKKCRDYTKNKFFELETKRRLEASKKKENYQKDTATRNRYEIRNKIMKVELGDEMQSTQIKLGDDEHKGGREISKVRQNYDGKNETWRKQKE